ncbi:hypothetical protein ACU42Y_00340 [Proteus mirabilis]
MRIELSILIYCILWCCAFFSVANESHIDPPVPVDLPTEHNLEINYYNKMTMSL